MNFVAASLLRASFVAQSYRDHRTGQRHGKNSDSNDGNSAGGESIGGGGDASGRRRRGPWREPCEEATRAHEAPYVRRVSRDGPWRSAPHERRAETDAFWLLSALAGPLPPAAAVRAEGGRGGPGATSASHAGSDGGGSEGGIPSGDGAADGAGFHGAADAGGGGGVAGRKSGGRGSNGSRSRAEPKAKAEAAPRTVAMRPMWRSGVPGLKLRVFQFDRLLRERLPRLHAHFAHIGLAPEVLASQWFLTLFAYALPFHALARCWDLVFADGWKMLFRLGLSRLAAAEKDLLPLRFESGWIY